MTYTKICENCGKEFTTKVKNGKYCSVECKNIAYNFGKSCKIYYHTCENCGKEFITPQKNGRFCSDKCKNNYKQQNKKDVKTYTKICKHCGKYFSTDKPDKIFCCKKCAITYHNEQRRQQTKKVSMSFTEDNYKECISVIVKYLIEEGIRGRDTCGISKYYNQNVLTDKLRRDVKTRDNYQCSVCGKTTGLEVHHIVKVKHGGTNEMDNLITLCSSCHRAIDTLNLEHAIDKCAKNAEKQLGIKHYTLDLRTSKEKVQDIQTDLLDIYKLLIGKIDDPDIEDIATQLNDIIDNIDNIKLNI